MGEILWLYVIIAAGAAAAVATDANVVEIVVAVAARFLAQWAQ